ncbi:glutamate-gated chloride channel alpha-like isoform X2 [Macrobrachium rosenbergii]
MLTEKTRVETRNRGSLRNYEQIVPVGYRQEIAPRELDGSPLMVNFSIKVNGIVEANQRHTSVILDAYFRVTWYDQRLNYPGDEADKSHDSIILNPVVLEQIWLPDPYIFNVRRIEGVTMLKTVQGVLMHRDKKMFISTALKIQLDCTGLFSRYPFDEQECPVDVYSYMYTVDDIEMGWLANGLVVDPAVEDKLSNFEFEFVSSNATKCDCYKCIPPVAPCVRANLILSRKALGHLLATFLPSGLFVAVSWASLFWPADVIPGRTVLVITSLLTLVSMHTAVRQSSPETSYIKAVDIWMFMCIVLSILILFEYGLVLIFRKYKPFQSALRTVQPVAIKSGESKRGATPVAQVNYEDRIDKVTRILIPVLFLLFNFVYWPYYL